MEVNESLVQELSKAVTEWERIEARSMEGIISEDEMEDELDSYLDTIQKFEEEYGMSKIGEGRDRITFTGGMAVEGGQSAIVKVSRGDGGQQNREEIEIWKEMDDESRECVAHLLAWSDRYEWIVQERVSQGASPSASRKVIEKLEENGWTCSDVSPDNVGVKNGEPVLMDLGVGLRRIS